MHSQWRLRGACHYQNGHAYRLQSTESRLHRQKPIGNADGEDASGSGIKLFVVHGDSPLASFVFYYTLRLE